MTEQRGRDACRSVATRGSGVIWLGLLSLVLSACGSDDGSNDISSGPGDEPSPGGAEEASSGTCPEGSGWILCATELPVGLEFQFASWNEEDRLRGQVAQSWQGFDAPVGQPGDATHRYTISGSLADDVGCDVDVVEDQEVTIRGEEGIVCRYKTEFATTTDYLWTDPECGPLSLSVSESNLSASTPAGIPVEFVHDTEVVLDVIDQWTPTDDFDRMCG